MQRPDYDTSDELQAAYSMALVNLTARAQAAQAERLLERLVRVPLYVQRR